MERRIFINRLIRLVILGVIALLTFVLRSRGQITRPGECIAEFKCNGCGALKNCSIPESEKQTN